MINTDRYVIIPLSFSDVTAMASIEQLAHTHPWSESALQDCFGPLYRVIGIKDQQQLVGFAIVQQIIDEATLLDVCVHPDWQGYGHGRKLMSRLIFDAKAAGAVVIMLEVRESNIAAKNLYENTGFIESGRRKQYYPIDGGSEDAILMDLSL